MQPGRPPWLPAGLFPFDPHVAEVAGNEVHHIDEGEGEVLLFVHGNPDYSLLWRRQIAALRDRFRCVALDLPGFGRSVAAAGYRFTPAEHAGVVAAFADLLDLRDATLIVHDWGGPIGLAAAASDPERYARLALTGMPASADYRRRQPWWVRALMGVLASERGRRLTLRNNLLLEGPLRSEMRRGTDPPSDAVAAAYRGPFPDPSSRTPTWVLAHHLWTDAGDDFLTRLDGDLGRLSHLPALLLYGGADRFTAAAREVPRLRARFRSHDVVVIDGAGHFFPESAPAATTAALRAWLERHPIGQR